MANQFIPDQGDEFKKKMTLITDVASDKYLKKKSKWPTWVESLLALVKR